MRYYTFLFFFSTKLLKSGVDLRTSYSTFKFRVATFQAPNSHTCLETSVLASVDLVNLVAFFGTWL